MTADTPVVPATTDAPLSALLDALAQPRPDPGGGAASAVVLAIGTALAQMVAGYSDELVESDPELPERLVAIRLEAEALIATDAAVSSEFALAARRPIDDPARTGALVTACLAATDSALAIADVATRLLAELRTLDRSGERRVHADVKVAAAAVGASLRASVVNAQSCLQLAQTTGATAADLLESLRRLAGLRDPLALADALASGFVDESPGARSR